MLFLYWDGEDVQGAEQPPFHGFPESFLSGNSSGNESHEGCGIFYMPAEKKTNWECQVMLKQEKHTFLKTSTMQKAKPRHFLSVKRKKVCQSKYFSTIKIHAESSISHSKNPASICVPHTSPCWLPVPVVTQYTYRSTVIGWWVNESQLGSCLLRPHSSVPSLSPVLLRAHIHRNQVSLVAKERTLLRFEYV